MTLAKESSPKKHLAKVNGGNLTTELATKKCPIRKESRLEEVRLQISKFGVSGKKCQQRIAKSTTQKSRS